MKNLLKPILHNHCIRSPPRLLDKWCLRVVKHTRTQTHSSVVAHQNIVVATPLATLPELVVVGQFRECNGLVAESGVQLHHRKRCRDTEQLCKRETCASQLKGLLLYRSRQTEMTILRIYNQTRCCHVVAVSPALNVTETHEPLTIKCHYRLTSKYLCGDVVWRATSDTRTALECRFVYELAYLLGIYGVLRLSKSYVY